MEGADPKKVKGKGDREASEKEEGEGEEGRERVQGRGQKGGERRDRPARRLPGSNLRLLGHEALPSACWKPRHSEGGGRGEEGKGERARGAEGKGKRGTGRVQERLG